MKGGLSADSRAASPTYRVGTSQGSRAWALALSASLILVVCIRFFSENLRVLPALVQYVDVPLTAVLVFCAFLRFIREGHRASGAKFGVILYLFVLVCVASAFVNSSRTELLPVAMFIFNFAAPLVFLIVTIRAELEREDIELVVTTFFWLGVVQLVIGVFYDLPKFLTTNNPDYMSGTFGHNAYQFTYFLGLWLLYMLGGLVAGPGSKRRSMNLIVTLATIAVFALFYAAQYRAMLMFFTLVILVSLWASPARMSSRLLLTVAVSAVSVITLLVVATAFPGLKLLKVFDLFEDTTPIVESGKVQAARNVISMYGDLPQAAFVGSGPATFSSRAYIVFASEPHPQQEAVGAFVIDLRGGRLYSTDVARRYVGPIQFKPIQGGTTVASPNSSFTSLAAEVGVLGLIAYLAAYLSALAYAYRRMSASTKAGDSLGARLAFTCFGGLILLLIQSLFDNWLETTRVAIPLWILVGLMYALERTSRVTTPGTAVAGTADGS